MYRKSGCIFKKTQFLEGKTETLQRKRAFLHKRIALCTENPLVYFKKRSFYKQRLKL